jgi:signal peptidase I
MLAAIVVVVLLAVRSAVAEIVLIPSQSMAPTLQIGDRVLVEKLSYRLSPARRGDLAMFPAPDTGQLSLKRVVAVAGDRVGIEDGVLVVNERPRDETYVDRRRVDGEYFGPIPVPPQHVFVLGDQRQNSRDSRNFGPIPENTLTGRVRARLWPPKH